MRILCDDLKSRPICLEKYFMWSKYSNFYTIIDYIPVYTKSHLSSNIDEEIKR